MPVDKQVLKPLHLSQCVVEKHDDCIIISINVKPNYELDSKILSFGPNMEVLSPESYRMHIGEKISWTNNLIILSRTKSMEERSFYLHLCVNERLTKRQLDRQIDSALYERNAVGSPKLSTVLREIAPQAEQIFRDQYVMEFIGGKEYEHENSMKAALVKQMKKFILEFGKQKRKIKLNDDKTRVIFA